ncbi:hypothetical protein Y032_0017g3313 [Ancylostoma ceylanicum]|nr:hypothetical protein Y032_0017g3313 [Ancylostoma ceylanicum]
MTHPRSRQRRRATAPHAPELLSSAVAVLFLSAFLSNLVSFRFLMFHTEEQHDGSKRHRFWRARRGVLADAVNGSPPPTLTVYMEKRTGKPPEYYKSWIKGSTHETSLCSTL